METDTAATETAGPDLSNVSFDDRGLVPAIVQDATTGEILMLAWMNDESLRRTLTQGTTWFWSRSRQEYWNKGATSGNLQHVTEVFYDCDGDALVVKVNPDGPACHTGERTCFYRSLPTTTPAPPTTPAPLTAP